MTNNAKILIISSSSILFIKIIRCYNFEFGAIILGNIPNFIGVIIVYYFLITLKEIITSFKTSNFKLIIISFISVILWEIIQFFLKSFFFDFKDLIFSFFSFLILLIINKRKE